MREEPKPAPSRNAIRRVLASLAAYRAHPDPRTAAANTLALVLASDGPLYPLYLYGVLGKLAWPSLIALWVVPVYAALPALARRHQLGSLVILMVVSIANTTLYTLMFGPGARLQLFLLPSITLGLFAPRRARLLGLGLGGVALGGFIWLRGETLPPLVRLSLTQYHALATLNEISVATLTWFLMMLFGGLTPTAAAPDGEVV